MADEFTTGNLYLGSGTNVSDSEFDIRLSTEEGLSTLFNASGSDIDFRVNASGRVGLHVDSDTGRVGIGTGQNIGAAQVVKLHELVARVSLFRDSHLYEDRSATWQHESPKRR